MPELEPLLYLRAEQREISNKGGGGGPKKPWVDVDGSGLRTTLVGNLDRTAALLSEIPDSVADGVGVPLRIALRPEALAKSNRPTAFLTKAGAAPTAAGRAGELFARVRRSDVEALRAAVEGGSSKSDLYAISTIDEFSVVDPITDAFRLENIADLERVVAEARAEHRLIRLDLFPWLNVETRWLELPLASHLESIGLDIQGVRGDVRRESVYVAPADGADIEALAGLYGVRHAATEPTYSSWREFAPQSMAIVGAVDDDMRQRIGEDLSSAIVGVLDSGIDAPALEPFVQARETYDLGSDRNPEHGTFVAGLILAGSAMNPGEDCFGRDRAVVIDGQVLKAAPTGENELLDRITETVRKYPEVKIWNCSFARRTELNPLEYSVFASEMDRLSAELGVLFVQAAGNYEGSPLRAWPPAVGAMADGIASPADAVNSLVVGSLSHRPGALTPIGAPASYSRRGPSFGGQTKPDVSFWSGDIGPAGELPLAGIRSVVPGDAIAEGVGTSFATPLVSAIAANVWAEIDDAHDVDATPALVKGLIVHGAAVNSRSTVGPHKNYYGAGVPKGGLQSLFEASNSFTTVHRVVLGSKLSWLRAPYPVPPCLFNTDGKLQAEIFMSVVYQPLLDQAFGEEAVRTCVDASFGVVTRDAGKVNITGKVPEEKTSGSHPWESELVASGKWSPVRTHYNRFPRGVAGSEWGLKLTLTERDDSDGGVEQVAYVFLTLRSFDEGLPVHADGITEVQRMALWSTRLSTQTQVSVSATS